MLRILFAIKEILPDIGEFVERLCQRFTFVLILDETALERIYLALDAFLLGGLLINEGRQFLILIF